MDLGAFRLGRLVRAGIRLSRCAVGQGGCREG